MIEEAQALGFYFDWDEEKDREKQKKKYLLDPQQYFENCAKAQAYYKANGHHFIPDDQPEAEWWKQSNDGSGMGKIPLLPPMNQGPNSNLTNEGFTCTQNDGSGMDELRPVPPLPKKTS
ncbi:predicted protein [Chaetoceros tenuissimus]|uniref:Uncharacterized protein n=1 Tax=Chaetoceros tenuissimus TaxID=426638 RepID=A0AAD3H4Y3_9STRA|nr:predicted protein [Chaetoceros tenuissimus]